ncbi:conserved protein of unknown function [Ruminococcaceae bacterium BL-6]|nr:conserved protein of unknown function [Ruminococcaceae bacterium BL-6]
MFLSYNALGGIHSADSAPVNINDINYLEIKNGIFDEIMATKDTSITLPISDVWDYNTLLHAKFQNNLLAGNIDFALKNISAIVTKVRKYGEYKWINIFSNPITSETDLNFENFYKYCKANTVYQFALVPILDNGIEGNFNINSVKSEFGGIFIMESDRGFYTEMEASIPDRKRNRPHSLINVIDGKYPYVIYPSQNQYDTFTVNGYFCKLNENGKYDPDNSFGYRDELMDFLSNGKPKFIKDSWGRAYIIAVDTNGIAEQQNSYTSFVTTSFPATQIGDANNGEDLFDNGLIEEVTP